MARGLSMARPKLPSKSAEKTKSNELNKDGNALSVGDPLSLNKQENVSVAKNNKPDKNKPKDSPAADMFGLNFLTGLKKKDEKSNNMLSEAKSALIDTAITAITFVPPLTAVGVGLRFSRLAKSLSALGKLDKEKYGGIGDIADKFLSQDTSKMSASQLKQRNTDFANELGAGVSKMFGNNNAVGGSSMMSKLMTGMGIGAGVSALSAIAFSAIKMANGNEDPQDVKDVLNQGFGNGNSPLENLQTSTDTLAKSGVVDSAVKATNVAGAANPATAALELGNKLADVGNKVTDLASGNVQTEQSNNNAMKI